MLDASDKFIDDANTQIYDSYAYKGGVYSPTENRIWFVPRSQNQDGNNVLHYIQFTTDHTDISPALMASAMFNKY